MIVKAYIGVHRDNSKSHTGCAIVLGESGLVFAKYAKQKFITKFSTEVELVGQSHSASQAIHLRNLIIAQGCDIGPAVVVYQCADHARRTGIREITAHQHSSLLTK
jgi:hypothetical protein